MSKNRVYENKIYEASEVFATNVDLFFSDCIFMSKTNEPLNLKFSADYISFSRCKFIGLINIVNDGRDDNSEIRIDGLVSNVMKKPIALTVNSKSIFVSNSSFNGKIRLIGEEIEISKTNNLGNETCIEYSEDCIIRGSVLTNLVNSTDNQHSKLVIVDSVINGYPIDTEINKKILKK